MPSPEETRDVLERHQDELNAAWAHNPNEYSSLKTYIERASDSSFFKRRINDLSAESTLFVFGGRMPTDGIEEIVRSFPDARERASCLITESASSYTLNALQEPAPLLERRLKAAGWKGTCYLDSTAENTGDQAIALISLLESITAPQSIVVCASIDHVGRMTATFMDALESRGLIVKGMNIIPFALGNWSDVYAYGFTHEELAFGYEPIKRGDTGIDEQQSLFSRLSGQYTFRWQRSLSAKERGEYKGRAVVNPSRALELIL